MRLEDVPRELMQHIQSRLLEEEAARTSLLSKSWLHAWSTIPTLRFHVPWEQERKHLKMVYIDRTLIRYLRDNIPIEMFDLNIQIDKGESASLAEKWIKSVSTKTCLKELSLAIGFRDASFSLPAHEILSSGENITKLKVSASSGSTHAIWMTTSHHPPVINCVSLRELRLSGVRISQQLLDHILSSCRLLVKIKLHNCSVDLKTIKVKSLPRLDELHIETGYRGFTSVEINDVPNLRLVHCNVRVRPRYLRFAPLPNAHSISLGSSLTQLWLGGPGLVTDDTSLDMFKLGLFPFLEDLTLNMVCWTLGRFRFACASPIKRFSLVCCPYELIDIQVNAPNLLFFSLGGASTMPSLSFPISSILEEITLQVWLRLGSPLGASFFLNMREALEFSSKCYVDITTNETPFDTDFDLDDDLRARLQFPPAMNVQTLSFGTYKDECLWVNSQFFDAFFEICHPKHVFAKPDTYFTHNNHFCKLMLREVLQKKTTTTTTTTLYWPWSHYLKHVQISTTSHQNWETLSNSHTSFLDGPTPTNATFKLEWC